MTELNAIAQSLSTIRDRLMTERQSAISLYRLKPRADSLLIALRQAADRALKQLLVLYPLPKGAALAAVGGFGRGELYPFSDVDLLILLPSEPSATAEASISGLVASMWDVGLEPGCSVRTIEQCLTEARGDITIETSLLELRWIAGSRVLTQQFIARMKQQLDPARFFQAKRSEMQQRHARYQDTPYALEPNCKESPGGLRDLQVILWMAKAAGLGSNWRQIALAGSLTRDEAKDLNRAEQAFKRLRIELHLLANRREDRLLFDLQHGLAQAYGIVATETRRASEILMQRYYWAARLVTQLNTLLVQTIGEQLFPLDTSNAKIIGNHYVALHNRLDVLDDHVFEKFPSDLLRVFLLMQQHPELNALSARALRAIWHARHLIDAAFRKNPENRRLFVEILKQEQGIVHALRRMTMLNILPRYLPAFRRVVGQMQHDLFHVYTVDQHTLAVLRNIRRFTMIEHAQEYPLATRLIAEFDRHWLLYVAALFHDIAKGRGGDHSVLGADEVKKFARLHFLEPDETELVVFLVKHHLLMSQVAQKKDLSDPDVISHFAAVVKTTRHLTALYLLTVADIRGTSPKVWNAWKGKLLENLFHQTLAALGGSSQNANTVLSLRMDEAASLTRLNGLRDEARAAFWAELDTGYFLRHDAAEIAWHTRHLYHCFKTEQTVIKARPTEGAEGLQVLVYTKTVKDLFARLCGYFGLRGLNIQDARIHTTRSGYALDSFILLPIDGQTDLRSEAALIEHELATQLDVLNLEEIKSQISARTSRLSKVFPYPPSVEIKPGEAGHAWVLDISAADRAGLLSELAQVFLQFNIDLQTAKVMTLGDRIEDVFVIKGEALNQPRTQRQFEQRLIDTLKQLPINQGINRVA
jgi:[protein-PII] uridylyltransferase